jgi:hypothetical protein
MSILRSSRAVGLVAALFTSACSHDDSRARSSAPPVARLASVAVAPSEPAHSSTAAFVTQQGDTTTPHRVTLKRPLLSEEEQRIADALVFAPRMTLRFLVAGRNRRLLADIGRVDLENPPNAEQIRLIRRVSAKVGPLASTTRMSVRGTWGEETDSIAGYDVWNGRIVAILAASARADSMLARNVPLVGVAVSAADDAMPVIASPAPVQPAAAGSPSHASQGASAPVAPATASCPRDSIATLLRPRVTVVRDSLVRWMTDSLKSPFPRLAKATVVRGDATTGCFASWRAVVIATSRTPSLEWNEERALLIAADGSVSPARLRDLRLRAHESLMSFDADGDGIDELAARGLAVRMGAQSVLSFDPVTKRFSRFASGFAWETR